jgi:hypothetical protein
MRRRIRGWLSNGTRDTRERNPHLVLRAFERERAPAFTDGWDGISRPAKLDDAHR